MASVTEAPAATTTPAAPVDDIPTPKWERAPAIATLYNFPTMEPLRFIKYPAEHLLMPLRKDILHRAVVYEGDNTRQGTASTKWRNEVRGSSRKLRPQKGTGRARIGDKKSPILRGGGVAHGPHPERNFATELPRKVYDKAWRTALSYRYRRGELFIVDDNITMPEGTTTHYLEDIITKNKWGASYGRSLLIPNTEIDNERIFEAAANLPNSLRVLEREDVDVKDLLETARVIIEKRALDKILREHCSDIGYKVL